MCLITNFILSVESNKVLKLMFQKRQMDVDETTGRARTSLVTKRKQAVWHFVRKMKTGTKSKLGKGGIAPRLYSPSASIGLVIACLGSGFNPSIAILFTHVRCNWGELPPPP